MTKARLLAALVDRRRNTKIQRILTGGQTLSEFMEHTEKGSDIEQGLPSLLVILQPFLWKEAFLQMDSRLGVGKVAFDEFVSFVLVSDSPSGAGRATLRQIFDTMDAESRDQSPPGRVPKSLILKTFSGTGSGAYGSRRPRLASVLSASFQAFLYCSSQERRKMFSMKEECLCRRTVILRRRAMSKKIYWCNGLSLREEALLKIRAQEQHWQTLEEKQVERGQTEALGDGPSLVEDVDDGCVTFGEFYDRCHLLASEVGKFVPVMDESVAREEAEVEVGEEVKARWLAGIL